MIFMVRRKTKRDSKPIFFISLLIILVVSTLAYGAFEYIKTGDYVKVNVIKVTGNTVVVGNNCTAIVAETSPERARSIQLGLEKKIEIRPNTHDIFAEVLKSFNITLEKVTIDDFSNDIYYANLYLKRNDKVLKIDLKPSDGIALALRTKSPIYIKKSLLEKVGQNICE